MSSRRLLSSLPTCAAVHTVDQVAKGDNQQFLLPNNTQCLRLKSHITGTKQKKQKKDFYPAGFRLRSILLALTVNRFSKS